MRTKGEIIAAILDFEGSPQELKEIRTALTDRIARVSSELVSREVAPLLGRGKLVRVKLNWDDGTIKHAVVNRINRKTIAITVDEMPDHRRKWRVPKNWVVEVMK